MTEAWTEPREEWIFTFGCGQPHAGCFVRIVGTLAEARAEMFRRHGPQWCMHYPNEEAAGVKRYGLRELTYRLPMDEADI